MKRLWIAVLLLFACPVFSQYEVDCKAISPSNFIRVYAKMFDSNADQMGAFVSSVPFYEDTMSAKVIYQNYNHEFFAGILEIAPDYSDPFASGPLVKVIALKGTCSNYCWWPFMTILIEMLRVGDSFAMKVLSSLVDTGAYVNKGKRFNIIVTVTQISYTKQQLIGIIGVY